MQNHVIHEFFLNGSKFWIYFQHCILVTIHILTFNYISIVLSHLAYVINKSIFLQITDLYNKIILNINIKVHARFNTLKVVNRMKIKREVRDRYYVKVIFFKLMLVIIPTIHHIQWSAMNITVRPQLQIYNLFPASQFKGTSEIKTFVFLRFWQFIFDVYFRSWSKQRDCWDTNDIRSANKESEKKRKEAHMLLV